MRIFLIFLSAIIFSQQVALANPYWDPQRVPKDASYASSKVHLVESKELKLLPMQMQ